MAALGCVAPEAQAAPVPRALLITANSIGPARLGMTVGALKRAFPGASVGSVEGPVEEDTLLKNGREILRFNRRGEDLQRPLSDSDTIAALRTSDPQFRTSAGIGPGSWLHNAEKLYGRPALEFWSEGESATFPRLSRRIIFDVQAPRDPSSDYNVAGIYTRAQLESLSGTTHRYRSGTKITTVGCSR